MRTGYVEQTTDLIARVEGRELLPHVIRVLSGGEPVTSEQLAGAAGWSVESVEAEPTAAWRDAHPDGHVYPVAEAFDLDREVIRQLGWEGR